MIENKILTDGPRAFTRVAIREFLEARGMTGVVDSWALSTMLGTMSQRTIRNMTNSGRLKAMSPNPPFVYTIEAVIDFLIDNPRYVAQQRELWSVSEDTSILIRKIIYKSWRTMLEHMDEGALVMEVQDRMLRTPKTPCSEGRVIIAILGKLWREMKSKLGKGITTGKMPGESVKGVDKVDVVDVVDKVKANNQTTVEDVKMNMAAVEVTEKLEMNVLRPVYESEEQYQEHQMEIAERKQEEQAKGIYHFNGVDVRVIKDDKCEPWFVAKDVCAILELGRQQDSTRYLDEDEKRGCLVNTPSSPPQEMVTISESGLYSLILRSRKPEAKAFKKWITSEVLPSIRKTGGYLHTTPEMTDEMIMARALLMSQAAIERGKEQLAESNRQLQIQAPAVEYCNEVLDAENLHTVNSIGVHLGISAVALNKFLVAQKYIYKQGTVYYPSYQIRAKGYCDYHIVPYISSSGEKMTREHLKWTEAGRRWMIQTYRDFYKIATPEDELPPWKRKSYLAKHAMQQASLNLGTNEG